MRWRSVGLSLAGAAVVATLAVKACSHWGEPRANPPPGWEWPPSEEMVRQGQECLVRLDERGVEFVENREEIERIANNITVPDMMFGGVKLVPRFREPPFAMDCHLALALARAGADLRPLGVAELRFSQIHDFRRAKSKGTRKNALSRHSYGLAVDVFEVVTEDGTVWSVQNDRGNADDSPENIVLSVERALTDSEHFSLVMSPRNDPVSHRDHFHLEGAVLPQEGSVDREALYARRTNMEHCPELPAGDRRDVASDSGQQAEANDRAARAPAQPNKRRATKRASRKRARKAARARRRRARIRAKRRRARAQRRRSNASAP